MDYEPKLQESRAVYCSGGVSGDRTGSDALQVGTLMQRRTRTAESRSDFHFVV